MNSSEENYVPWLLAGLAGVGIYLFWTRRARAAGTGETLPGTAPSTLPGTNTSVPQTYRTIPGVTREMILEMQTELNRIGCEVGAPSGVWGPTTDAAIRCVYAMSTIPNTPQQVENFLNTTAAGDVANFIRRLHTAPSKPSR